VKKNFPGLAIAIKTFLLRSYSENPGIWLLDALIKKWKIMHWQKVNIPNLCILDIFPCPLPLVHIYHMTTW